MDSGDELVDTNELPSQIKMTVLLFWQEQRIVIFLASSVTTTPQFLTSWGRLYKSSLTSFFSLSSTHVIIICQNKNKSE